MPISSAMANAASGLRLHQAMLDRSAHRTANLSTPGFRLDGPAASGDPAALPPSETSLVDETVAQVVAARGFEANVAALRTADDAVRSLLDVRA